MIEVVIRQLLMASQPVYQRVAGRIYPLVLPQAPDYPAITYQIITGDSEYTMQGPARLSETRVQLDLYAGTSLEVFQLKGAVMQALSGARGEFGSPPVRVQGAFRRMEMDAYEVTTERAGPRVWRKTLDFQLWFKEQYDG